MIVSAHPLSLSLIYTGYKRVEQWWNFKNVISPFYRILYIESGSGRITVNNVPYDLEADTLFLIPKHASHCYECDDFNTQYYICFFDNSTGSRGIPEPSRMRLRVKATAGDRELIKRFLALNPHRALPNVDPRHYDNKKSLYVHMGYEADRISASEIESEGILMQLFSRFITPESMIVTPDAADRVNVAMQHIQANLHRRITIEELSETVCVSRGYLTRQFRRISGMSPNEYIQHKRVERAQHLLYATSFDVAQIATMTGVLNPAQFSKLFIKVAGCTPTEYRCATSSSCQKGSTLGTQTIISGRKTHDLGKEA